MTVDDSLMKKFILIFTDRMEYDNYIDDFNSLTNLFTNVLDCWRLVEGFPVNIVGKSFLYEQ